MMLKACFFSWDEPSFVSGCRPWIERLVPELSKHRIEPSVLYIKASSGKDEQHVQNLKNANVHCVSLPPVASWTTPHLIKAVREALKSLGADVFVPNFWLPGYYAAADLKKDGIETVGVLHSDDPYYWGLIESTVVKADANRSINYWVAVSQFLSEALIAKSGARPVVAAIPAGVRRAKNHAKWPSDGTFRIGYFGRIVTEQKRILDVANAMLMVAKKYPNASCEIYGFGPQEQELRSWLATHAQGYRVQYCGGLQPDQALKKISEMQAVLLLSDYEGLSVTLMESMAAGVPPISFDCVSGTRELIQPGVNGFIVKDRDSQVLNAIGSLIDDRSVWESMSAECIKTLNGPFSLESGAREWKKILRMAANNPKRLVHSWIRPFANFSSSSHHSAYPLPPIHPAHGPSIDIR